MFQLKLKKTFFALISSLLICSPAFADVSREEAAATIESAIHKFDGEINELNLRLDIEYHWDVGIFQAQGGRLNDVAKFEFYGALLKAPMTLETLTVVVCHEVGHLLGGLPEVVPYPYRWNSAEGQADYYATAKCLKRLWKNSDNESYLADKEIADSISRPCSEVYAEPSQQALCKRTLLASLKAFQILYEDDKMSYENPDREEVSQMLLRYPSPQCRLDTLKAGALCDVSDEVSFSFESLSDGACIDGVGARPKCWFKTTN